MSTAVADKRKHPKPGTTSDDPMMKFHLAWGQHMDRSKKQAVYLNVNGYEFEARYGQDNVLPKSVVSVLKNGKTYVSGTPGGLSTPHRLDTVRGGEQKTAQDHDPQISTIPDYDVIDEREA